MNQTEFEEILEKHKLWVANKPGGVQADLACVDLRNVDLRGVDLSEANLNGAILANANLSNAKLGFASLRCANLYGAKLKDSDLQYACLENANLAEANLVNANLTHTHLEDASLNYANLKGANLSDAFLENANLSHTKLQDAIGNLLEFRKGKILTEPMIGYKKCMGGVIVTLEIPEGAIVFSINGYKCRTNKVKVIAVEGADVGISSFNGMSYRVGDNIIVDDFDCQYNAERSTGIHFFVGRKNAENY